MSESEEDEFEKLSELTERVQLAKLQNPGMFVSSWEADENDITTWTQAEIERDPGKQLLISAENDDIENARTLLTADSRLVNATDGDGYTPLHRASYQGNIAMMKLLLSHGANPNASTTDGWMPIHNAAFWSNTEAVDLLLQMGVDVNAGTNSGQTPLHLACSNNSSLETIAYLLSQPNVNVNLLNSTGESPVDLAKRNTPFGSLFEAFSPELNQIST